MDKQIDQKLETLLKYVPFIDYILNIDNKKYVKFIDIRKWILNKKRYCLSDLNKMEQSIITQYKNLILLHDKKLPRDISQIFCDKHQFVDLCSDDEDSDKAGKTPPTVSKNQHNLKSASTTVDDDANKPKTTTSTAVLCDSDDDIEIVSYSYPEKSSSESNSTVVPPAAELCRNMPNKQNSKTTSNREEKHKISIDSSSKINSDLDDVSAKLLKQIDQISCEDNQGGYADPHNYHADSDEKDTKEVLFQRRSPKWFKRRDEGNEKEIIKRKNRSNAPSTTAVLDTISLDSSDDEIMPTHNAGVAKNAGEIDILAPGNTEASRIPIAAEFAASTKEAADSSPTKSDGDSNTKLSEGAGVADNNPPENLSNDQLCRSIEGHVRSLDTLQLQKLLKYFQKGELTEPSSGGTETASETASPSSSRDDDRTSNGSPIPPAPRLEQNETSNTNTNNSMADILKALEQFLQKIPLSEARSASGDNCAAETNKNNAQSGPVMPNERPFTPAPLPYHHPHHYQPSTHGFYGNSPLQPIHQPNHAIMHPGAQQMHAAYPPNFATPLHHQMAAVKPPHISLNSRDPRTRSALYQNTTKIIEAEMAKRNNNNTSSNPVPAFCPPLSVQQNFPRKQSTEIPQTSKPNNESRFTTTTSASSSPTTTQRKVVPYGEYRRRLAAEQLKSEQQREQENKLKEILLQRRKSEEMEKKDQREKMEAEKREKLEAEKTRNSIHSLLFTTLRPYEDRIAKAWKGQQKQLQQNDDVDKSCTKSEQNYSNGSVGTKRDSSSNSGEKENADNVSGHKRKADRSSEENDSIAKTPKDRQKNRTKEGTSSVQRKADSQTSVEKEKPTKSPKNSEKDVPTVSAKGHPNESNVNENGKGTGVGSDKICNRFNRVFKEMECTFKGYEQLHNTIGGKRRSSIHARSVIAEQLNLSQGSETPDESGAIARRLSNSGDEYRPEAKAKGGSSPYSSSLTSERMDNLQEIKGGQSLNGKRRSSVHARTLFAEQLNYESLPSSSTESKRRKTVDDFTQEDGGEISSDSESNNKSFPPAKAQNLIEIIVKNQPSVVLTRLTPQEINKHIKRRDTPKSSNILNVHLVEAPSQPCTSDQPKKTSATTSKKAPPKRPNNDCQMTERNTKFCSLCSSKPSDLTNHYVRKHKCESYVSRLTWSELDELCINTPFAKMVTQGNNSNRIIRYAVACPFCDEKLVEPFMDLYNHYASHTGEYAFQCAECSLDKPYRADIKSHQLHSKICRNSYIQTLYRYPSNTMTIYLHYCTICNFVQLNEANILKHLREHHDPRKASSANVRKCILAAISDGPETASSESLSSNNGSCRPQSSAITGESGEPENSEQTLANDSAVVVTKSEMDFKIDDNIPVCNEAFSEEPLNLEEQLKQMHEGESATVAAALPMTVLHFGQAAGGTQVGMVLACAPSRHLPRPLKTEAIDVDDNFTLSPARSPSTATNHTPVRKAMSSPHAKYRTFPMNVNYLGFYKCMTEDCYYSSDSPEEFLKHLEGHQEDSRTTEYLLCPYCNIATTDSMQSIRQLLDHMQIAHSHLVYQCSVCCYRSCEPSNVAVHQTENHPDSPEACQIYKCSGPAKEVSCDANYIRQKMHENVGKVQCQYCSHNTFYNTMHLMHHINSTHNAPIIGDRITRYSCVYCFFSDKDQCTVRKHVALKHPNEVPFLCDHNLAAESEDLLNNLQPINMSQPVAFTEKQSTVDAVVMEVEKDVKPSLDSLLKSQEDIVRVRLRKLTQNTGVAPDCLYRCPEQSCGGFFSIYDLWLRHMRVKHLSMECRCPHCPTQVTQPLQNYETHFEEHRRHTYVCIHCPKSFANTQNARDHWARDHSSDLGSLHMEQIRFNLHYSYYIMAQANKYRDRADCINSICDILGKRLKELENKEASELKTMWSVPLHSTPWLEQYPKGVLFPRLFKKCFNGNCNFRTIDDEILYSHVRTNHQISGSIFKCSKCDFRLENSSMWDDTLNHIKQHSETSFFLCCACRSHFLCRSKLSDHIREDHAARDVPIVNLFKRGPSQLYAKVAIIFANERLTFSTLRNCFCCEERDMRADVFTLHLKRYHNFVLNYFCEWCNLPIESLLVADKHFQQTHTTNKLKIRCELSSKDNLSILSVDELRLHISRQKTEVPGYVTTNIKTEPTANDDSVIILENDDVVVEDFVKKQEAEEANANKPKLKCIAMQNLLDPSTSEPVATEERVAQLRILPRIKIVKMRKSSPSINAKSCGSENYTALTEQRSLVVRNAETSRTPPIVQPTHSVDSELAERQSLMGLPHKNMLHTAAEPSTISSIGHSSNVQPIHITESVISSRRMVLSPDEYTVSPTSQPYPNSHVPDILDVASNSTHYSNRLANVNTQYVAAPTSHSSVNSTHHYSNSLPYQDYLPSASCNSYPPTSNHQTNMSQRLQNASNTHAVSPQLARGHNNFATGNSISKSRPAAPPHSAGTSMR